MPDISKYLKQAEELDKKRGISSNPSVMPAVTPGGTVKQTAGPDISAYLAQAEKLDRERSAAPTTTPNTTRADGAGVGGNGYEIQMPKLEVNALGAGGGAREGGNLWDRIRDTLSGGIKQSVGGNVDTMGTMYEATQGQRDTLYDQQREWTAHQLARAEADLAAYTADGNAYMAKVTQGEVERLRTQLNAYDTVKQGQVQQKATTAARDMAAQVTQSGAQDIERAKEGLGLVGQALVDAGASGVQMLGDASLGALTGVGGLAPMAFRAFGGGTQKARAEGADLDEQILYGGAQAAKEWVTEKLFSVALPFAKTYGKGSLDDVVEKSIGKAVDRFAKSALGKRALGGGLTLGAAALGEGLEEGLGTFLEWQLPRIYGGDVASFGETLEEAAYNTLVGSLSGLAGGVVTPQVWSYQQTAPQTAQGGAEAAQEGQNAPAAGNETPAPSTGTQRPQNTPVSFENTAAADILLGAAPQKQRAGFTSLENAMANQFERETGISIESVESILGGLANGDYNSANWVARIAQDAKDPKMVVVAHELTHHLQTLAPQEYESFRTAVADYFTRAGGEAALTDMMNRYRSAYGAAGQNLSDSAVMDEMAADFTEVLLTDADLFGQFAQQNRTLAERLLDALRAFIEKIRATFTGRARDAAAQEATGKTLSELEMIAEQWQGVYSAAAAAYGQNANTAINKERADAFLQTNGAYSASVGENIYSTDETVPQNEEGVKRYSLNTVGAEMDSDGRQLSEGQKAYFANSKSVDAQGRLRVMYRGGNSNFTVFDRKKSSYANLYGRGFYFTDSKSHAEQYGGAREFYLNITNPVPTDETTITREQLLNFLQAVAENEDDYSFENYGYGATPESMMDAIYSGKSDFAMLYDVSQTAIGDMVEAVELFNEINGTDFDGLILDTETVIFNSEQAKLTDNKTPTDNPDIRFSLKSPVEETARLIALHNLTEEKLLGDLKLGGLPMPSIAVVLAEAGHAKYGDISLVFGKDTIDPQFMRRNKVYGGDAWTPTYPRVEYKVDDKALRTIRDKIRSLVPYETSDALGGLHLDSDNMTDTLNRYNGDMVDAFKRDIAMKYVYLKDTGSDISLPTKESDLYYYGEVSNAAVRYFAGKLVNGLQTVELYRNMGAKALMQDEALKEAVADALNWDVLRSLKPGSAEYTEYERNPVFRADEVSFSDIDKFLDASKKLFRTGVQKTVDYKAAKELIVDTVDQAAYESWLRNLFSEIVEKEGIRNNKDVFTPSGNRRSFEALHYEHNLENVIKAMRESGEKGIGFGGGSIFGAATTEFSSIEEMKQSSDRLQKMSEEEYQKMREGFSDRFFAIASSLPNNKGSFTATDDAANMLVEAVTKYNTKRGIANYLQRESKGWATYSEQAVDDLIKLVSDIRKMPTAYFEAKPQRAVGFDEVLAAVVPDNTGEALLSQLAERGINVLTYKKGDDADRLRAVNSVEDAKFSLKSTAPLRQMMAEMPQQMMIRMPRLTTVAQDEAEAAGLEAAPVEDTVQLPQLGLTDADVPGTEPLTRQDIARELAWRARMANEPAAPQAMGEVKLPELSADMDEAGMGVADFTGNVETVPQETTAEILSALEDLSRDMEAPMETPTDATVRDAESLISAETVEAPQSLKEKAAESWAFFKRKMVDSGEAVTQIGKAINDKYLYPFYNMARASASAGANMIAEEQTDVNGRTVGESLNAIFDPIRAKGEEYYTQFQTYMYDLHNIARMSMDQKAKQEQETAEAALAAYTADHPKFINMTEAQAQRQADSIDELEAEEAQEYLRLVRWVNRAARMGNKPVFDYDFTAEMSRGRSERLLREHPEFAQYREQVRKYIDNMMQYRVDSGLITQQDADFLREYYPDYIPTYRRQAFEDFGAAVKKKRVQIGKTVGRATGGNTKLVPLHEALGKQTMQVVREGSKNRFGARLLQDYTANASNADIARYVRNAEEYESDFSIDTFDSIDDVKPKRGNTFSVYLGGKLYDMTVDNALFEAVEALSPTATEQNTVTKVVRDVNKLYKALITGYNPTFAIRNTVRDLQTAGLYSRDFAAWAKNYPKALAEIKNDGPMWKQYKALGGDFSSVFDYMTGTVKKPTTKAGKVMDKVQALNMAMEQAPRLAEFMAVMESGDGSMESAMDAMLAAADVTVNFGRGGTWGKMLNANYVPFLNPGIQGFDKMVRYATQSRSGKQWLMMATRAAALGIAPSLINDLLYKDDEEWEELRDSDKDTNYMFKLKDGMWLKIPKGRELSVLGIAADRVGDALQGEEVDIRATLNTMANQVAPANPLNQNILKAAYDTQLFDPSSPGRTWYGGDIEGQRLQNYAPGERYDSSTDVVSKAIGGALNLSPKKLNYLADQYTGVVGDIVLPLLTPQAERDMFSKAFTVDSISSNELSSKFYEKSDELTYAKNGGDAVAAVVSRYWNSISSDVSKLYGEIRNVENSNLANREKKKQVQELQRQINAIQSEALATVDQYTAAVENSLFGDDDDAADFAYRETNREVFGAKSALETYNKDVYAKAQEAAKNGVSYEAYYDYYFATKDIEGDKDASGKTIPGSKREKVLAEINAMDLTVEQKNALYYASGYAESTLYEAPWYTIQMPRL